MYLTNQLKEGSH